MKSYILLVLFCASTVSSFATIHRCEGQITDFELFTIAECDEHEEEQENSCHDRCCKAEESESEPCCDTSQLNDNDSDLVNTVIQNISFKSEFIQSKINFKPITVIAEKSLLLYASYSPPPIDRNILVDIQCFRI